MVDSLGSAGPYVERPTMPGGYGMPFAEEGLQAWSDVEQRLVGAQHYWLATVRPNGRPHVVPRWGVWVESRFYYDGAPSTVHASNLATNPACSLNLESGTDVVVVEGTSHAAHADAAGLGEQLAAAFVKYHDAGYSPGADAWAGNDGGGLRVLVPQRALAWSSFPIDATRFVFPSQA